MIPETHTELDTKGHIELGLVCPKEVFSTEELPKIEAQLILKDETLSLNESVLSLLFSSDCFLDFECSGTLITLRTRLGTLATIPLSVIIDKRQRTPKPLTNNFWYEQLFYKKTSFAEREALLSEGFGKIIKKKIDTALSRARRYYFGAVKSLAYHHLKKQVAIRDEKFFNRICAHTFGFRRYGKKSKLDSVSLWRFALIYERADEIEYIYNNPDKHNLLSWVFFSEREGISKVAKKYDFAWRELTKRSYTYNKTVSLLERDTLLLSEIINGSISHSLKQKLVHKFFAIPTKNLTTLYQRIRPHHLDDKEVRYSVLYSAFDLCATRGLSSQDLTSLLRTILHYFSNREVREIICWSYKRVMREDKFLVDPELERNLSALKRNSLYADTGSDFIINAQNTTVTLMRTYADLFLLSKQQRHCIYNYRFKKRYIFSILRGDELSTVVITRDCDDVEHLGKFNNLVAPLHQDVHTKIVAYVREKEK